MKKPSYKWSMQDHYPKKLNGYTVFSCFAGGGGSTMGYKLAGFNVLGCNEIEKRALNCYVKNHNPRYLFDDPIQNFKKRTDLPDELFHLDILDGSPPCTTFSKAGNREKDWGKKRKYKEGNFEQILDTLFFDFIDLAERLQSKIVITENVQGLLVGNAKKYVQRIYEEFNKAGYFTTHRLLDGSLMGIPQKRMRVFFFSIRKDLLEFIPKKGFFQTPDIKLKFNEQPIKFKEIYENVEVKNKEKLQLTSLYQKYWKQARQGDHVGKHVNCKKMAMNRVPFAQTTGNYFHPIEMRQLASEEYCAMSTFPDDYDFGGLSMEKIRHITGMSVPPIMMEKIATQVKEQWLDKIKSKETKSADNQSKETVKRTRKRKKRTLCKRFD